MSLTKLITNYTAYNSWANKKIVEWLKDKPKDLFDKEVPSSYSTMVSTLNHILAVQEYWYSVVAEIPFTQSRFGKKEFDLADILSNLIAQSEMFNRYAVSLSDEELNKVVKLDAPWAKGELPRYEFIQHMINHSTYHRGQLVTMGRVLGITDAPGTDYNFFNLKP